MGLLAIILIILILVIIPVGGYFAYKKWFKKPGVRKYKLIKDPKEKKYSGTCVAGSDQGTKSDSKDCKQACDDTTGCNGYDLEDTCTLYTTLPTSASYDSNHKKKKCYALVG